MKLFCLSVVLFLSASAHGQNDTTFFNLKKHLQKKNPPKLSVKPFIPKQIQVNTASSSLFRNKIGTSNYGLVYALPQDNMPCIAPDTSQFQTMPNAATNQILRQPIDPSIYIVKRFKSKS